MAEFVQMWGSKVFLYALQPSISVSQLVNCWFRGPVVWILFNPLMKGIATWMYL